MPSSGDAPSTAGTSIGWDKSGRLLSRRGFLIAASGLVAGAAGAVAVVESLGAVAGQVPGPNRRAVSMAMHVHASASEGPGSMQAQLDQAARHGIDVLWWTEHDHRMSAHAAPLAIGFTGLTETPAAPPQAATWTWTPTTVGAAANAAHDFVTADQVPEVSPARNAVRLRVEATGTDQARHLIDGQAENTLNRTSLADMAISFDVRPIEISPSAFLSLEITTSYRPQAPGLPAGQYRLSYRIGGGRTAGTAIIAQDTLGVVTIGAPVGQWTTATIRPEQDLVRIWPGMDGRDASLYRLSVAATAFSKGRASGYVANLRFSRNDSGQAPLDRQRDLMRHYADRYSTVRQLQALEVSLTSPHLGWYGGQLALADTSARPPLPVVDDEYLRATVGRIHGSGGLVSYCHPFGTSVDLAPPADQETARVTKAAELVKARAYDCDLLEVGYRKRGGCGLAQHESVWDNCSRNAIFLTGLGTNDDHEGQDWINGPLNFITWAWAADTSADALLKALNSGNVFFGDPAKFRGRIDLRVSGRPAMGAVAVSSDASTNVDILAADIARDGTVDVLRGTVDFAGPDDTEPEISTTTLRSSDFTRDSIATIKVDTSRSRFLRVVVKDATGLPIGLSNPVWLLRSVPASGIPPARSLTAKER